MLYERLVNDGVDAWLDKEKLLPGQDWELEIRKAVREADVVVVCLSKDFNKAGFRQKEVRLALDTAIEQPEGEIFIIPARLEESDTLEILKKWHWVDLFENNGYEMLMRSIQARAESIGATLQISNSVVPGISAPREKPEKTIEEAQSTAPSPAEVTAKETDTDTKAKSPNTPSIPTRKPFKLKTEYVVALIGAAATIIAAIIGSPLIERWLTQSTTPVVGSAIQFDVQTQSGIFKEVNQTIDYRFAVTNKSQTSLTKPVTVINDKMSVTCPDINTVGNSDDKLDPAENFVCTSTYTITQTDLNNGSVTNTSYVIVGTEASYPLEVIVQLTQAEVLELSIAASPTTYNQTSQLISFSYVIKNNGTSALGPAQFVIHDDRVGSFNCGGQDTRLPPDGSISCSGQYITTDYDQTLNELVFNTVVNGGGATTIQPITLSVVNTGDINPSTSLAPGVTIQHHVEAGESLFQIARCYGANFESMFIANPQVNDPNKLPPDMIINVPNIGSEGQIYGPPCATYYTVQSGDTWQTIAIKFNTDLNVLLDSNKGISLANGVRLRIPPNSPQIFIIPTPVSPIMSSSSFTLFKKKDAELQDGKNPTPDCYNWGIIPGQTLTFTTTTSTDQITRVVQSSDEDVLETASTIFVYGHFNSESSLYEYCIYNRSSNIVLYTLEVSLSQ